MSRDLGQDVPNLEKLYAGKLSMEQTALFGTSSKATTLDISNRSVHVLLQGRIGLRLVWTQQHALGDSGSVAGGVWHVLVWPVLSSPDWFMLRPPLLGWELGLVAHPRQEYGGAGRT